MNQKLAIYSDLHIKTPKDPAYRSILNSMKELNLNENDHLVFLGDIFDLMVGKTTLFRSYAEFFDLLKSLECRGVEIFYVEGNHDFHMRGGLKDWGISKLHLISNGSFELQFLGKNIYLTHGDLVNPKDYGYLFLRGLLRSPPLKALVGILPGGVIQKVGNFTSQMSRDYTAPAPEKREYLEVLYRNYACLKFKEGYDVVVSGHNHLKDFFQVHLGANRGLYLNSGYFPKDRLFVYFDETLEFPEFRRIEVLKALGI